MALFEVDVTFTVEAEDEDDAHTAMSAAADNLCDGERIRSADIGAIGHG